MKRKFSTREKVLLIVLGVIIVGLCYYKIFLTPLNDRVDSYNSMASQEQEEADTNMIQVLLMKKMQNATDELKAQGVTPIPTFDNSSPLMIELNSILSSALEYNLNFGTVTNDEYIVMRPVDMTFETRTYKAARAIIDKLYDSNNLMEIGDMNIRTADSGTTNHVIVTLSLTYYEIDQDYQQPVAEEAESTAQ